MITIIDDLNRERRVTLLDKMFRLRARVFADRLGWDVAVHDGMEKDRFDELAPGYVVSVDESGEVVGCLRMLQTTGPHMLSDVFSDILQGEEPLRSPTLWESTRFCVDTDRLSRGTGAGTISHHTCEVMIGALEFAMSAGVTDAITVIDPVMDRVLRRSGNGPYDYVGQPVQMGKVKALAGLIDCTEERLDRMRDYAGIDYDVFMSEAEVDALTEAIEA